MVQTGGCSADMPGHTSKQMSLHPGLVKRIDTLNRSFSLIDQYSVVLQIQVHTVV